MWPLAKMTGKQQRTFGSFYFAIDHPLPHPFWQWLSLDFVGQRATAHAHLDKLLAYGFCLGLDSILPLYIGRSDQRGGKQKRWQHGGGNERVGSSIIHSVQMGVKRP